MGWSSCCSIPTSARRSGETGPAFLSAVEEMLRWVSPIKTMARTTTADVDLEGVTLSAGTKVVLLYESANFDEGHFDDPERFDVARGRRTTIWRSASARTCASVRAWPAWSS